MGGRRAHGVRGPACTLWVCRAAGGGTPLAASLWGEAACEEAREHRARGDGALAAKTSRDAARAKWLAIRAGTTWS